mmetsp:Transcript_1111/g.2831  ORF Transcript_1111/g.2831 Transcript_1111/m.2831 type:complete len:335 (-) Transcript_1111:215-1219(-)
MESHVENTCLVALEDNFRCTVHHEVEYSHQAILAASGQDVLLRVVPSNTVHGLRMRQPVHDRAVVGVHDTGRGIVTTRGNVSRASLVPFAPEGLARVDLLPHQGLTCIHLPDEEVASTTDRTHFCRVGTKSQAVEQLLLAGVHLTDALVRGDAPKLDITIVRRRADDILVLFVEGDVENSFRMARGRKEAHSAGSDVANTNGTVLERQHKPVRFARDRLDAKNAAVANSDLAHGRALRDVPELQQSNSISGRNEVARLSFGPGKTLDGLRLLFEAVHLCLLAGVVKRQSAICKGNQKILIRQWVPLGVGYRIFGGFRLAHYDHLLLLLRVVHNQ